MTEDREEERKLSSSCLMQEQKARQQLQLQWNEQLEQLMQEDRSLRLLQTADGSGKHANNTQPAIRPNIALAKRREQQREQGGALVTKMEMFSRVKNMPWGLELDADTLCLRGCAKESLAGMLGMRNAIGMELDSINGVVVLSLDQVERQLDNAGNKARLHFQRPLVIPPTLSHSEKVHGTDNQRLHALKYVILPCPKYWLFV